MQNSASKGYRIAPLYSHSLISRTSFSNRFTHPTLTDEEMHNGTRLGIDSWADTACSGKHAYVQEFLEGKSITATGFTASLGSIKNLPMANVAYAYDMKDGTTILLEHNNTIYMGEKMEDSLCNPIQCEDNGVKVDIRPKEYYSNDPKAQTITISPEISLPLQYDGVLPYLPVRKPTPLELDNCERYTLTSENEWNPYERGSFSIMDSGEEQLLPSILNMHDLTDPISAELTHVALNAIMSDPNYTFISSTQCHDEQEERSINQ